MKAEERKRLLEMARRRAVPGSGSLMPEVREGPARYGSQEEIPDLDDIKYIIVGGLATACYMPQRMTLDTDLLVLMDDFNRTEERLDKGGCRRMGALSIGDSSWKMPGGRPLDLIALDQSWVPEALDTAVNDAAGRPFASLPFLVLMKLESGRLQDLADISRMLGCADGVQVDEVRSVINRYRPQDIDDVESMLQLGRLEQE